MYDGDGLESILKGYLFSNPGFPEMKATRFKTYEHRGLQNEEASQIDPDSLPHHFPTLLYWFEYAWIIFQRDGYTNPNIDKQNRKLNLSIQHVVHA